jgi:hypothetical protein
MQLLDLQQKGLFASDRGTRRMHGEVGINFNPTDTVAFGADPMTGRRSGHSGRPYHCARLDARRADLYAH